MHFDTAMLGQPSPEDPSEAAHLAMRLLSVGGRLRLEPPEPPRAGSHSETVDHLERTEDRRSALTAVLAREGITVEPGVDAEIVLLPSNAPADAIMRFIDADRPVALLNPGGPIRSVGLLIWGHPRRARRAAAMLRHRLGDAETHLLAATGSHPAPEEGLAALLGWSAQPRIHRLDLGLTDALQKIRQFLINQPLDLLVVMTPTGLALRLMLTVASSLDTSLLLVPSDSPLLELSPRLELFDATVHRGQITSTVVRVDAAGFASPVQDEDLTVISRGTAREALRIREGALRVGRPEGELFGVATDGGRPVATLEASARVLDTAGPAIALVPHDVPTAWTRALSGHRVWAVCLATVDPAATRRRDDIDAVLHDSAVLVDGGPADVPTAAGPVTFDRVARALRSRGYPVAFSLCEVGGGGYHHTATAEPPSDLAERIQAAWRPPMPPSLAAGLVECAGAVPVSVDRIEWLTDNTRARQHLLGAIDRARERVWLQSYMFEDDPLGRKVAEALAAAATRGIEVRVLVDSLWSMHGSLQRTNPVLSQLDTQAGLTLRLIRPVDELVDLKRRNHRKMLIVDRRRALISGRNLDAHYYTGFGEAELHPDTPQDAVPWLDVSAAVEGDIVAHCERLFEEAWRGAGGESADLEPAPVANEPDAWWIPHNTLTDAATLDAVRVLLEHATERVGLINTFPLCHELQHALVACLERGVAVSFLTGHVRPRFKGGAVPFPGSAERDLMTELIHGRLDALVEHGGEVYAYGHREPSWPDSIGRVLPHVHAKLLLVDGRYAAFGSANYDISSSYWDSELMVVLDDRARTAEIEAWFNRCIATSKRFDPADAEWATRAAQRAWISQRWPSILS